MTALQLRKKVHACVDNADERLLKMVLALMQEYEETDNSDLIMTVEEAKELYRRSDELRSGKVKPISLEDLTTSVRKKLKK